jgi:uncharacterized OB-fold protein
MPQAAYCRECGTNVYVRADGRCPDGHGPESLSNYYEVETWPGHPGATGPSSMFTPQTLAMARWARVALLIVIVGLILMCVAACALSPFLLTTA